MKFLIRVGILWLPVAIATTGLCLLTYVAVQQVYRQTLNDPQIQIAEDAAAVLAGGAVPASLVERGKPLIDISKSLSPWIAVYDVSGKALESSAVLDGAPPQPPLGVFNAARTGQGKDTTRSRENRVTWQPRVEVRSAIVVVYVPETEQYVVSGRSMRESERRVGEMSFMVFFAWLAFLGTTFFVIGFARRLS